MIVELLGKPCTGKTAVALQLEQELRQRDYAAVDVKSRFSNPGRNPLYVLGKKAEANAESSIPFALVSLSEHFVSRVTLAILLHKAINKPEKQNEIYIFQRDPLDAVYSFGMAFFSVPLVKFPINKIAERESTPDNKLVVYLYVPNQILENRLKERSEGKDLLHKRLLSRSDAPYADLFKKVFAGKFLKVGNYERTPEETAKEIADWIEKQIKRQ
ncbi:MAG: hypothetical protein ACP5TJ_01695 [Candidatus Micrarchaeia archaeon]